MTTASAPQRSRQRISLQSVLIIPFLVQIFAAVGLTGYFSLRSGQKAVEDLATQLQAEVSDRVDQHLDAYLATPSQINEINLGAVELGMLDLYNFDRVSHYFWHQMQAFDVGYINFGDTEGNFIGVERLDDGGFHIIDTYFTLDLPGALALRDDSGAILSNRYEVDEKGHRMERLESVEGDAFDHREEAWYSDAAEAQKPVWSSVYQWEDDPDVLSLSSSYPVYDAEDTFIGVIGVDHIVSQISDFLATIEVSPQARIVVLERDGNIVASSSSEKSYVVTDAGATRLKATESGDSLIRAASTYLQEEFSGFEEIGVQQLSFDLAGEKQYLQVAPWQDELGLDWLVMVAVPESDFMGQINRNRQMTVLLCLVALAIATTLGILTARWIAKPILKLQKASREIASGELSQQVNVEGTQEVATLGQTFNRMTQQLRESFQALERSKAELEARVEERTADINNKNVQLADALENVKATQRQMIAQEKLASLGSLTAGIAHEIKNPLNFVSNFATLAAGMTEDLAEEVNDRQDQLDPEFFEEVTEMLADLNTLTSKIHHHGKRADSIVVNMLQHSRNGTGEREAVDINAVVAESVNLAYHGMRAKQSEFNLDFDNDYDDSVGTIQAMPQALSRVFLNIASNACYAIYQKQVAEGKAFKPLLKVRTRRQNGQIEVHIRDNGPGISPEMQEKIFEQFFTTKPTGEGTGLGLSLSYNIVVEQLGGTLTVESEEGIYTDFIVTLPA